MDNFDQFTGPVICVAAHPKDIEIHAGGTVARLVQAGVEVSYVLCTSGNRGTSDLTVTMAEVGARREDEQRQAAAILGYVDISQVWTQKIAAVYVYKSQGRHLPEVEPFFRHIAGELGAKVRVDLAEGFRRLTPS